MRRTREQWATLVRDAHAVPGTPGAQSPPEPNPSVANIASLLHVSPRTLGRRLGHEGTTFKELLADLRRQLALRYVGSSDLGLAEIAFLLGFSQSAAFHRAFKRWTSQTPLEYRRMRRQQPLRS